MYIQNNRKSLNLDKEHAIRFSYCGCGDPPFITFFFLLVLRVFAILLFCARNFLGPESIRNLRASLNTRVPRFGIDTSVSTLTKA